MVFQLLFSMSCKIEEKICVFGTHLFFELVFLLMEYYL
jgi:hypothetical protein